MDQPGLIKMTPHVYKIAALITEDPDIFEARRLGNDENLSTLFGIDLQGTPEEIQNDLHNMKVDRDHEHSQKVQKEILYRLDNLKNFSLTKNWDTYRTGLWLYNYREANAYFWESWDKIPNKPSNTQTLYQNKYPGLIIIGKSKEVVYETIDNIKQLLTKFWNYQEYPVGNS